jgi:hypothetical protein
VGLDEVVAALCAISKSGPVEQIVAKAKMLASAASKMVILGIGVSKARIKKCEFALRI